MAKPNQATRAKRDREKMLREWQQEKHEKRALRSEAKKERDRLTEEGIDPDLAGIVPGPQPVVED